MVKKTEHILNYYLISRLTLLIVLIIPLGGAIWVSLNLFLSASDLYLRDSVTWSAVNLPTIPTSTTALKQLTKNILRPMVLVLLPIFDELKLSINLL